MVLNIWLVKTFDMGYAYENYYKDEFENYKVIIFIGRDADWDEEKENFVPGKIISTQLYGELSFNNTIIREDGDLYGGNICGEFLRDQIGYGPAKDMLTKMNIPKNSTLWKLGEK